MKSPALTSQSPQEKPRKEFIIIWIVVAIVYGLPPFIFLYNVLPILSSFLSPMPDDFYNIFNGLEKLIPVLSGVIIGLISGCAAYRSAKNSGSIRNSVIGTSVSIFILLIGMPVFAFACMLLVGFLYEPSATSSDSSGYAAIIFGSLLGICVTYILAVISGAATHYILVRRSVASKPDVKIEEGAI